MTKENKPKIKISDLRVEKLDKRHIELLREFKSTNKELKDFLVEDALDNQDMDISTTYLFFYNPLNKLIAYATVCTDAIRVHGTRLGNNMEQLGISYRTLPALKVCRLCVDKEYERRGIGTTITYFAMKKLLQINEHCACRFLIVDAKREAVQFYKKMDFEILRERQKGTISMYYDMIKLIRVYNDKKDKTFKPKE